MPIAIRETIVTPADDHDVIQLRISDAPLDAESASLQLTILAKLRPLRTPALAHLQREAMAMAQDALTPILQELAKNLNEAGYGLHAPPKGPAR
jgi:hypothetical protein